MLDQSPDNLLEECQGAEKHNLKHLAAFPQTIQIYTGAQYREDMRPVAASPENYPYSYVANVRPRLVFTNPRFNASSESSTLDAKKLLYQAKYVNRWAVQENLQKILIPYVTTALLLRSVILMSFDDVDDGMPVGDGKLKQKMPHAHLLENHRYFRDPVSTPAVPPRYKGHTWVRDWDDVKKMPGVDKKAMESLVPDIDLEKLQRPNDMPGHGKSDMPARLEIVAYEMWVPECNDYRTNRGHNGTIFTIAVGQSVGKEGVKRYEKSAFLLPPRPYYGPPWGPYTELEYVDVPGQTYGTSPVSVVMEQVEELNAHLAATADGAARMKNLVFVDAANDTLQIAVQNSPDGSILGVPNITKEQIIQVMVGGTAPQQYENNEILRQRLDRNIGMDASQRGGGGTAQKQTATYTNVQSETLNVRMQDLKRTTAQAVKQIANTVSWYGWESNNVAMILPPEDAADVGVKLKPGSQLHYYGGPQQGETLPPWDSAALELEPYSMEAIDEETLGRQVAEAMQIATEVAQIMEANPWMNAQVILDELGKLRKFDWLHELINVELFAEWMKETVQQKIEAHQSQQAMQAAQIEAIQIDNQMKKMEMMLRMREASMPVQEKPPSVSIGYKDLPEDMKRVAEREALGSSSTMPLTSPAHIQNALDVHKTNAGMQQDGAMQQGSQQHDLKKVGMGQRHDMRKMSLTQQHDTQKQTGQQKHQLRMSELSAKLGKMAGGAGKRSGPVKARSGGQKALANSR